MSPTKKPERPVDIYVRVSRTMGREGESFISPKDQEKRCRAQLAADGYRVGKVFVDLDESGATQDRPAFNEVMNRIRDGVSGGVVVARLNRLGRTTRGVLDDIAEIESDGAAVLAVEEKLDTSSSIGRFVLRMFASISELELDRIRDSWATAHASMIERGIQAGRVPVGYTKNGNKRLVPNEPAASIVREAFRLRAEESVNWHQLARFLTESGLPTQRGGPWLAVSARKLIGNRSYLGEVRHGSKVNRDAHEALVDERTFRLANAKRGRVSGERGDGPLLGGGLLRCATCGAGLYKSRNVKGNVYYRCQGDGPGHPTIAAKAIEDYLIVEALRRLELDDGYLVEAEIDPEVDVKLANVLAEIEELDRLLEDSEISPSIYAKAMAKAEADRTQLEELVEAQESSGHVRQLSRTAKESRDAARALLVQLVDPEAAALAPGEIPDARKLLKETLGKVVVHKGRGKPEERVTIEG